jgi:polyhydroxyalkanoate synthase
MIRSEAAAIDRMVHALLARQTGGISPVGLWLAAADWAAHLAFSPGTQLEIAARWADAALRMQHYAVHSALGGGEETCRARPAPSDRRFEHPGWQRWPFNLILQAFLLQEQVVGHAALAVNGVTEQHRNVVNFCARQAMDMAAPSNFLPTNPEVLERSMREGGQNLVRGAANPLEDSARSLLGEPPAGLDKFELGKTLAATPGQVVYRDELIELIQYAPTTRTVRPEPILIVPAWIMKYYVLDLSASNSMVKYLIDQGFSVFMISWKNPDPSYSEYGLDDYRRLGVMAALAEVERIGGARKIHAVGYCLGGTLLSIAAAAMARDGDDRLRTMTLLAAQTDFSDAGELEMFISSSELTFLEDMMKEFGVLEGTQMAATFQLLRSNDLIWSRWLHDYLMGERWPLSDLMAWNADATRMPARMHSEYLRRIYLENQLAEGKYMVGARPVALRDIRLPVFVVGTEWDHVAPWRSVYKLRLFADGPVTFLLTNGGHNAGIVSEPGHPHRCYRVATSRHDDAYIDPDRWLQETPVREGSWWPEWSRWLSDQSGEPVDARSPAPGLCAAPGTYIFE